MVPKEMAVLLRTPKTWSPNSKKQPVREVPNRGPLLHAMSCSTSLDLKPWPVLLDRSHLSVSPSEPSRTLKRRCELRSILCIVGPCSGRTQGSMYGFLYHGPYFSPTLGSMSFGLAGLGVQLPNIQGFWFQTPYPSWYLLPNALNLGY